MSKPFMQTGRLTMELETTESVLARIAAIPPEDQVEVSPVWLARLRSTPKPTVWTHGVVLMDRETGAEVGSAAFKGPPNDDGMVEIAFGIAPTCQGRGYAKEAVRALTAYALGEGGARYAWAHTRHDNAASARVLAACGLRLLGDVVDPEDGLVQRWEHRIAGPGQE